MNPKNAADVWPDRVIPIVRYVRRSRFRPDRTDFATVYYAAHVRSDSVRKDDVSTFSRENNKFVIIYLYIYINYARAQMTDKTRASSRFHRTFPSLFPSARRPRAPYERDSAFIFPNRAEYIIKTYDFESRASRGFLITPSYTGTPKHSSRSRFILPSVGRVTFLYFHHVLA